MMIIESDCITYINPAGLRIFEREEKREIINQNFFNFIHPRYHKEIKQEMSSIHQSSSNQLLELQIHGSSCWRLLIEGNF